MSNFEIIAVYLRDEGCPKTPHDISVWTCIKLEDVYDTLRENRIFFREIIKDDELIGWIIDNPFF